MLAVIVAIVVVAVFATHGSSSVDITHKVTKVALIDSRHIGVWTVWTNEGKRSATESCVMNVTAYNDSHQQIGAGSDATGPNGRLLPGHTQRLFQVVVVTENAAGVTSTSDVKILDC